MLDWSLIAIGFGIGVAVAAPMGPVNIMVIHRGVRHGFLSAFVAGLGAVIGDTIFAAGIIGLGWFVLGLKTGHSIDKSTKAPFRDDPESENAVREAVMATE